MAQQSEIDICNLALQQCGEKRILSLTDVPPPEDEKAATTRELCALNYPISRDATLEDGDWTFAARVYTLAQIATPENDPRPPLSGNLFQLPGDVLRVMDIDDGSGSWSDYNEWDKLEDRIVADIEMCYAFCIIRVEDTLRFSSGFVVACAARLAAEIAAPLTESNTRDEVLWRKYQLKLEMALARDGGQGAGKAFKSNTMRRVRLHGAVGHR